jgi:predicted O-methyltransferase YrrM
VVYSPDAPPPPRDLLELGLHVASEASLIDLSHLHARSPAARQFLSTFPGEHYQLLTALVRRLRPAQVVEIGTYTGLSALALTSSVDHVTTLTTFDVVAWDKFPDSALRATDFHQHHIEQRIGDLADRAYFDANKGLLSSADLIFVDGPKDGRFEPIFLRRLIELPRRNSAFVVLDDIRVWNMLSVWESLALPKLDLTSFGHWSGTGLLWLSNKTSVGTSTH